VPGTLRAGHVRPRKIVSTRIDTVIIGAGQSGLAVSRFLTEAGHEHVLLERGSVGQRWHDRWDSLTLLSPNWMNELPGGAPHADDGGFLDRAGFLRYLDKYAAAFAMPVLEGVAVRSVTRRGAGFLVETNRGMWLARNVVVATGHCDVAHVPFAAPPGVPSLHGAEYRRPGLVSEGPVLVVGGGATGQQLALELRNAGREVILAVGRHSRAPRTYRGRDIMEWLHLLGDLDRTIDEMPDVEAALRVPMFPLSGANGGEDLGLELLASLGVTITGRLVGFEGSRALFADDLEENLAKADRRLGKLLRRIDECPLAHGTTPEALEPLGLPPAPTWLDTQALGAIVWATGYRRSYAWLRIPSVLDDAGELIQRRGATPVRGLYVVGLSFQYRRNSHFIGGVGRDAEGIARHIVSDAVRNGSDPVARGSAYERTWTGSRLELEALQCASHPHSSWLRP
jgi:putative flavoprotein involved in K+ transport